MITSPRRTRSEQVFLLFPRKLHKESHFPWVRTNYLGWRLHLTHCQLCDSLFELSLYYIDCIFSSSCFPSCSIWSLMLLGLVLKMGLSSNWKKVFFLFLTIPSVFIKSYFKVGLSPSKKICIVCFTESPLKWWKMLFISS